MLVLLIALSSCEKDDESSTFYWDETGCSDPWKTDSDDTEQERKESIELYLEDQKVKVEDIEFKFDSTKVQGCKACFCTTGRIIVVNVSWSDKGKMKNLNFYQ
jgi:hypothetical protein